MREVEGSVWNFGAGANAGEDLERNVGKFKKMNRRRNPCTRNKRGDK